MSLQQNHLTAHHKQEQQRLQTQINDANQQHQQEQVAWIAERDNLEDKIDRAKQLVEQKNILHGETEEGKTELKNERSSAPETPAIFRVLTDSVIDKIDGKSLVRICQAHSVSLGEITEKAPVKEIRNALKAAKADAQPPLKETPRFETEELVLSP